jgi:hypothetical protein
VAAGRKCYSRDGEAEGWRAALGVRDQRGRRGDRRPLVASRSEHRKSSLFAINHLSNLDKHRRLTVMAWWPAVVSGTADGESKRSIEAGDRTYDDGSVVGYVTGLTTGSPTT